VIVLANSLMNGIWDENRAVVPVARLSQQLQEAVELGFERRDDRTFLRKYANRLSTAPPDDAYGDERWVNDVHLESKYGPSDARWRANVVDQAVTLVRALLPRMARVGQGAAQALVTLQSAPGLVDPDLDYAAGNVRFILLRDEREDLRSNMNSGDQPELVFTTEDSDLVPGEASTRP
jgi:hypothetical protein